MKAKKLVTQSGPSAASEIEQLGKRNRGLRARKTEQERMDAHARGEPLSCNEIARHLGETRSKVERVVDNFALRLRDECSDIMEAVAIELGGGELTEEEAGFWNVKQGDDDDVV